MGEFGGEGQAKLSQGFNCFGPQSSHHHESPPELSPFPVAHFPPFIGTVRPLCEDRGNDPRVKRLRATGTHVHPWQGSWACSASPWRMLA